MQISKIYIHHSAIPQNSSKQFWKINEYHKAKWNFPSTMGYFGGYNYLLEQDGELRQYRADGEEQAAQKGENTNTISICLAGNFEVEIPTPAQKTTLEAFLADKTTKYGLSREAVKGHRESKLASTLCPGKNLMSFIENYRKPNTLESLLAQIEIIKKKIAELMQLLKSRIA